MFYNAIDPFVEMAIPLTTLIGRIITLITILKRFPIIGSVLRTVRLVVVGRAATVRRHLIAVGRAAAETRAAAVHPIEMSAQCDLRRGCIEINQF
jgi:hypothetical protein